MKPKLKRTLYIGLGGTGFKTLLHTKRAFIETYGEVPPMIKFLVFDSDQNQYKNYVLPSIHGDVTFDPAESSDIMVKQAKEKVSRHRSTLSWLPERNLRAVQDLENGCGMVRTNGRVAFSFNYNKTRSNIKNALNKVCSLKSVHNDKYDLISQDVEVNIVFSIAGGTGSGNFIDTAYLVKDILREQALENSKVIGYMVLPDVYDAQLVFGKERLLPNGYGSIIDLDYMMHYPYDKRVPVNYLVEQRTLTGTPFNTVIAVGNSNHNGDVVSHSDDLSDMLSMALVVSAGELSSGMQGVANNLEQDMNSGDFDISQKRAVISTLGMSEITFRASELSELYRIKAAREIAATLLRHGSNVDSDANAWIDSVGIRENNDQDQVIDKLLQKNPNPVLQDIYDKANPRADINNYRNEKNIKADPELINKNLTELKTRTKAELDTKLQSLVDTYGPVYAIDFVTQLREQFNECINQMRDEKERCETAVMARESAINTAIEEYKSAQKKFFGKDRAVQEATENLCGCVTAAVINDREIGRRNGAITFYTWLSQELDATENKLTNIQNSLLGAMDILNSRIAGISNSLSGSRGLFEIDLTQPYVNNVRVEPEDININQFVMSLPENLKVYDFDTLTYDEVASLIINFTEVLNSGSEWEKMGVEEALEKLPKAQREEIIKRAISLSSPMCALNFQGHLSKELNNYYYIGVEEQSTTGLTGRIIDVKDCITNNQMFETYFSSIGSRDRIVFYHQYGVFPTFALAGMESYQHAHDRYMERPNAYSCFIDEDLRLNMARENYTLMPTEKTDNSLELWVKGLIFGLIIRDENGVFLFKDEDNDEAALDGYFTSLGTPYRDEAFRNFKREASRLQPQYETLMANRIKSEGQDKINRILADAKLNYEKNYSLNQFTNDDLKNPLYKNIRDQLLKELKYIKDNL